MTNENENIFILELRQSLRMVTVDSCALEIILLTKEHTVSQESDMLTFWVHPGIAPGWGYYFKPTNKPIYTLLCVKTDVTNY